MNGDALVRTLRSFAFSDLENNALLHLIENSRRFSLTFWAIVDFYYTAVVTFHFCGSFFLTWKSSTSTKRWTVAIDHPATFRQSIQFFIVSEK